MLHYNKHCLFLTSDSRFVKGLAVDTEIVIILVGVKIKNKRWAHYKEIGKQLKCINMCPP